ncbi:MAG TPA: hypothetical protein VJ766_09110 [Pseudoxanthomonas sp.]|uniref:hypothetical protein n=1 Tax=Pseudoxanthomonas sp. SE1 TaxID=1664560 RepID=UPI00240D14F5|nr:hypothetical protein [Pseudoxanthomonas sp. SE1]WFC42269.1 hypothetical protein OY559_01630 [Pseudoxanthomonas sp. SE1]HJS35637.1 hypothetical protein [Pseudoxanthomonas sp.]
MVKSRKTRDAGAADDRSDGAGAPAKLVRDSFTMPAGDFALVAVLKGRALQMQRPAKKSELLRAGLHALSALSPQALAKALDALAPVKAGRPKKK